ncbi:MAG: polysaccharide biosynthesis C-terminal domain-containing protein [Methanoregulaceae archaeon]|nr:polysaccharide biosynthesis C-terminal domain-containing protein [Methanoregulaceae archaeon]
MAAWERLLTPLMGIGPVRRQSIIGFMSTIGMMLAGFLATIYIAHATGPASLGAFFLMITYLPVISLFTDMGTGGAALRLMGSGEQRGAFFSAQIAVRGVLLIVVVLLLVLLRPFFIDLDSSGLFWWLTGALVVSTSVSTVVTGVYSAGKAGILQLADLIGGLARILVQLAAVYLGYSAAGLAGGVVAGLLVTLGFNAKYLETGISRFGWGHIRQIVSMAPWIGATAFTVVLLGATDTILLGYFMDLPAVGLYRTAFQLASLPAFTMLAIRTALYPKIAQWRMAGDVHAIEMALSRAVTFSLLFAVPAITGGWILSDRLLYYLYGSNFVAAAPALVLLLAVQPLIIVSSLATMCLFALDRQKEVFISTLAGLLVLFLTGVVFVPYLGITGAAVACMAANLVAALFAVRTLANEVKFHLEKTSVRNIVIAAAVMGGIIIAFRLFFPVAHLITLMVLVGGGAALYLFLVLRSDPVIREEIRGLSVAFGIQWPRWL